MNLRLTGCFAGLLSALITVNSDAAERGEEERLEQRLEHMWQTVELLQQADQADLAREAAARAESMARELQLLRERWAGQGHFPKRPDADADDQSRRHSQVLQRLDELSQQVNMLREEVAGLRQHLDERRRQEEHVRFAGVDLSGRWLVTLPAGFEYETVITPRGERLYQVKVRGNLAGLYRHHGNRLSVEIPSDERLKEFVWTFQDKDLLLLTAAPPAAKIGSDYRGATLRRTSGNPATAPENRSGSEVEQESE